MSSKFQGAQILWIGLPQDFTETIFADHEVHLDLLPDLNTLKE